ncbi:MAG TPA: hypothetical protein DDZ88_07465 [Verrucomicrobiales bacterium]|nr:hypothetical protein [Verrucomicrobiales bacterium]
MVVTVLPSIVIALVWRPLGADQIGLLLGSVIAGGFTSWTVSNFLSGVYTSKQGIYRRDEAPIRYWTHTIIIAAATVLVIFYWIHQIREVTGTQPANKSRHSNRH